MASNELTKLYEQIESAIIKGYEDFRFIPTFSGDTEQLKILIFSRWKSVWELQGEKAFSKSETYSLMQLSNEGLKKKLYKLLEKIGFA